MCSRWACYSSMQLQSTFLGGLLEPVVLLRSHSVCMSWPRGTVALSDSSCSCINKQADSCGPGRVVISVVDAQIKLFSINLPRLTSVPRLQVPPVLPSSQLRDQAVRQLRRQRGVLQALLVGSLMQAPPPSRLLRRLQRSCSM